jgi:predicted N-formylglutamate amidohydrolase
VPANRQVTNSERQRRIAGFYNPYHAAIDHVLAQKKSQPIMLLSVHSFAPILNEKKRPFDLGILFDRYEDLAQEFGQRLSHNGYQVRHNEPYSGYDGLIYSAGSHGKRNDLVYLEIEMNNRLLLNPAGIAEMGQKLSQVLKDLFAPQEKYTA